MRKLLKHSCILIPTLLLAAIILVVPQLDTRELMDSTQSGKSFGLLYAMLGYLVIIILFVAALKRGNIRFRATSVDLLLAVYSLTSVVYYWLHPVDQLQIMTFAALVLFYLGIRAVSKRYLILLLVAGVVSGTIQAIYGNLQLWGYFPSHHGLFKMTGSFFNPGPYAGYLAAIFPISLGLYLFDFSFFQNKALAFFSVKDLNIAAVKSFFMKRNRTHFFYNNKEEKSSREKSESRIGLTDYSTMKSFFLVSIISICLVLPASRSRAAWLAVAVSSAYLLSVRFKLFQRIRVYYNTSIRKYGLLIFVVLIIALMGSGLYYLKKESADGRLLIWKVSSEMIKEKPVFGHGYGGFKKHYMDFQAGYFKSNPDSKQAMVAGDTNYTFNELIQATVENGITGLLFIIAIVFVIFFSKNKTSELQEVRDERICRESEKRSYKEAEQEWGLLHISRAVILSILVFGLFSYPSQILPIKICLIVAIACVASNKSWRINRTFTVFLRINRSMLFLLKSIALIGFAVILWSSFSLIRLQEKAYAAWKNAFDLYNMGLYDDCLTDYEKAYPILKSNGDFLTNYGKALSMAEKHEKAITVLTRASQYYPNIVVYTALGDSYRKIKQPEQAEQAYLHAWYMNPSRFYPKYLLAKLYDETGQKEKAVEVAKELLEKDIKVESTAIEEIKEEMRMIIEKNDAEMLKERKIHINNNLCHTYHKQKREPTAP